MTKVTRSEVATAVQISTSWVEVATKLGRSKSSGDEVKKLAISYDIDFTHIVSHMDIVSREAFPNHYPQQEPDRLTHRRAAIGKAINWFLSNGYSPSLPVEVEKYDLVVESASGFRKVQVKSSENLSQSRGRYSVALLTTSYDEVTKKYVQRPYQPEEIDDFFICCSDGKQYLIPFDATKGKRHITVTDKFKEFLVGDITYLEP